MLWFLLKLMWRQLRLLGCFAQSPFVLHLNSLLTRIKNVTSIHKHGRSISHQCCSCSSWDPFHTDLLVQLLLPLLFPFAAAFYTAAYHTDENEQDDGGKYSIDGPSWHCCDKNNNIPSYITAPKQRSSIAPWNTSEGWDETMARRLKAS